MLRNYRVILEVDIEIELEEDQYDAEYGPDWDAIEGELEEAEYWDVWCDVDPGGGQADVSHVEVDSYELDYES